ncbi:MULTISPECIES: SCP2 domain-containing protein [unclassified Duganella]|uniref:ubiquinone anaerobic biosynthesis accessory factor UbiT n=1 Tax=unclassified Duganella TaxID=2636909 RepID=UPI000874D6E9|nr:MULTISPECIES: SCP2 sterol-binding domain-containing protein [unclassified Duganella]OEZ63522.1 SCP-2 sterol transfer family protein [Duganella sp. HH105]OFA03602.1 SCP-2 sterol transfer family protein [Duganella sp. HH101]
MNPVTTHQSGGAARPLPAALAAFGRLLPAYPGAFLCVAALNLVLRPQLPDDVRASLQGKHMRVCVTDAGVSFDFTWRGQGFAPLRSAGEPDLEIGACTRDFIALARREQDPDTLFFSRRLSMQGDTELGLLVKNTLDATALPLTELGKQALTRLLDSLPGRRARA